MKMNKHARLALYAAILILGVVGLVKHFHIKDFAVIEPDVLYISGQPMNMDYTRLLYKYHIGSIVNVRLASEHRDHNWYADEISWVRSNGVNYFELPIDKNSPIPDAATQEKFLELMSKPANLPVLVHGNGNTMRVALLTGVWLVKGQHKDVDETIALVGKLGEKPLTPEQIAFIKNLASQP